MRRLVVVLGLLGLVLGLVCAVTAHYLPVGGFGWFAYTPLASAQGRSTSISFTPDWFPTLWVLPAVGLGLGLVAAVVLHGGRWSLSRR